MTPKTHHKPKGGINGFCDKCGRYGRLKPTDVGEGPKLALCGKCRGTERK